MICNFKQFSLNESISIKESKSKDIFKEFGLDWFIINNELPDEYTHIFLHPIGGYRTMVFDFGVEYTFLKENTKKNLDKIYQKVKNIIQKYDLYILTDVKNSDSFYVDARLEGEENITEIIKKNKKIYHATLNKYLSSILENGLNPTMKSPDLNYDYEYDKTHFTTNPFNEYEKNLLFDFIMGQKDKNDKPILLEIDISNLDNDFYLDKDTFQMPEENIYNFWINSKIPAKNIKVIKQN